MTEKTRNPRFLLLGDFFRDEAEILGHGVWNLFLVGLHDLPDDLVSFLYPVLGETKSWRLWRKPENKKNSKSVELDPLDTVDDFFSPIERNQKEIEE